MSCAIPSLKNMTSLLPCTLFTIDFCSQEDNGSKETLVYRRNSWRNAQFSLTSACLHVTLLARVGWRVDRRDADSFSIWKESCPGRGGVMEGNDIIHLEFICYSPEKKTCAWDLIQLLQRTTIWFEWEITHKKKQSDCVKFICFYVLKFRLTQGDSISSNEIMDWLTLIWQAISLVSLSLFWISPANTRFLCNEIHSGSVLEYLYYL